MNIQIKNSARSRSVRLAVHRDGRIVVTKPKRVSQRFVDAFVAGKRQWIEKKLEEFSNMPEVQALKGTKEEYEKYKEVAREYARQRLEYFNQFYGFKWNTISIKNTSTRWGSCSKQGNLNFSYKIALIAPELSDYIIVHELCHLGELNHSKAFWNLVAKIIPDYKKLRKQIKLL